MDQASRYTPATITMTPSVSNGDQSHASGDKRTTLLRRLAVIFPGMDEYLIDLGEEEILRLLQQKLSDVVPTLQQARSAPSQADVFSETAKHLHGMKKSNADLAKDVERIEAQNAFLDRELQALERAAAANELPGVLGVETANSPAGVTGQQPRLQTARRRNHARTRGARGTRRPAGALRIGAGALQPQPVQAQSQAPRRRLSPSASPEYVEGVVNAVINRSRSTSPAELLDAMSGRGSAGRSPSSGSPGIANSLHSGAVSNQGAVSSFVPGAILQTAGLPAGVDPGFGSQAGVQPQFQSESSTMAGDEALRARMQAVNTGAGLGTQWMTSFASGSGSILSGDATRAGASPRIPASVTAQPARPVPRSGSQQMMWQLRQSVSPGINVSIAGNGVSLNSGGVLSMMAGVGNGQPAALTVNTSTAASEEEVSPSGLMLVAGASATNIGFSGTVGVAGAGLTLSASGGSARALPGPSSTGSGVVGLGRGSDLLVPQPPPPAPAGPSSRPTMTVTVTPRGTFEQHDTAADALRGLTARPVHLNTGPAYLPTNPLIASRVSRGAVRANGGSGHPRILRLGTRPMPTRGLRGARGGFHRGGGFS